ncbi:MAG: OmpA family protein [Opitutaceae bacterium]|nr:OmpA family protein [Cytophagales bacterium]
MKNILLTVSLLLSNFLIAQTTLQPTDYDAVVIFKVTDDKGAPEQGAVVKLEDSADKKLRSDTADLDGNTSILLKKGSSHKLSVEKSGVKFDFGVFEIPRQDGKFTMEENLQIKIITKYNRIYELKIHFGPNKSELYENAKIEIDKLYEEMVKNPTMKIEVAGHTDNVGDDAVNFNISQKRANSIKSYLVEKGIPEKRITAKGYGETAPISENFTEEGRTKNRRIEIRMM